MPATYHRRLDRPLDELRFRLGDVDVTEPLLSDEEITAALRLRGSTEAALAYLAAGLLAQFSHQPSRVSADGTVFDFSDRIATWQAIIAEVRALANGTAGGFRIRRAAQPQNIQRPSTGRDPWRRGEYS